MKVLLLENNPSQLIEIIRNKGVDVMQWSAPIGPLFLKENRIEFIVSYGYRHLVRKPVLDCLPNKIVNLHISYLPWNRGADPNLWSFLEDTPKGVSIHVIDQGIDTGDIIVQKEIEFQGVSETLATTYKTLHDEMIALFQEKWVSILSEGCGGSTQATGGSYHKSSDKAAFAHLLTRGWDTPVCLLKGMAL